MTPKKAILDLGPIVIQGLTLRIKSPISEPNLSENLGLQDETRDELGAEFHKKLDLKDGDERVAEMRRKIRTL
ncbi:hypothetical protein HN51_018094 [Arachis hypogaea]